MIEEIGRAVALAARAGMYPREAALVREWAIALEVDGRCGWAAVKALSPGRGVRDDLAIIEEVEEAARKLGLVPSAGREGGIRLPSSLRSRGKMGARKRYYMRRWVLE